MSEPAASEVVANKENNVTFVREAPKLHDALQSLDGRGKQIINRKTLLRNRVSSFTEKDGLINLDGFVQMYITEARKNGDEDKAKKGEAFSQNLAYVGEPEIQEAAKGIANRFFEEVKQGGEILVFVPGRRSENFT